MQFIDIVFIDFSNQLIAPIKSTFPILCPVVRLCPNEILKEDKRPVAGDMMRKLFLLFLSTSRLFSICAIELLTAAICEARECFSFTILCSTICFLFVDKPDSDVPFHSPFSYLFPHHIIFLQIVILLCCIIIILCLKYLFILCEFLILSSNKVFLIWLICCIIPVSWLIKLNSVFGLYTLAKGSPFVTIFPSSAKISFTAPPSITFTKEEFNDCVCAVIIIISSNFPLVTFSTCKSSAFTLKVFSDEKISQK